MKFTEFSDDDLEIKFLFKLKPPSALGITKTFILIIYFQNFIARPSQQNAMPPLSGTPPDF